MDFPNYLFFFSFLKDFNSQRDYNTGVASEVYERCAAMFDQYRNNQLNIENIFDIELLAKHAALSIIFGSFHGLDINNQRFYCNPITGKIEPIAFDSYDNDIDFIKISIKEFTDLLNSIIGTNPGNIFYKHLILELEKYSDKNF